LVFTISYKDLEFDKRTIKTYEIESGNDPQINHSETLNVLFPSASQMGDLGSVLDNS